MGVSQDSAAPFGWILNGTHCFEMRNTHILVVLGSQGTVYSALDQAPGVYRPIGTSWHPWLRLGGMQNEIIFGSPGCLILGIFVKACSTGKPSIQFSPQSLTACRASLRLKVPLPDRQQRRSGDGTGRFVQAMGQALRCRGLAFSENKAASQCGESPQFCVGRLQEAVALDSTSKLQLLGENSMDIR